MKRGVSLRWAFLILLLWAGAVPSARSQTFTTICDFGTQCPVGQQPVAGLVQGSDGNFYGTAILGGSGQYGTVFKITPTGTGTVLYNFCSQSGCADGQYPYAALVQGTDGNFYGTTGYGGANGQGTIFKITPSGALTTLYSFCSQSGCADGANPYTASLIQGADGNFYGTTANGGAFGTSDTGGTVFKITPDGVLTPLYSFCAQTGCTDGSNPSAALVQASDGNIYGTTLFGGSTTSNAGTVFKITSGGMLTTLYTFCPQGGPCSDGQSPWSGLVVGTDGNLYGETYNGGSGAYGSGGTIFKITTGGALTTLYSFCAQSGCTDGAQPTGALALGTDGNFYGTTYQGGSGVGTLFRITPTGNLSTLYTFAGSDGAYPFGELLLATDGSFYGTTSGGGSQGAGTAFRLSLPAQTVSFATFTAKLSIVTGGTTPGFSLTSAFTLGQNNTPIFPLTNPVTLTVGSYTVTIPAASFKLLTNGSKKGSYVFSGTINGVSVSEQLRPTGANSYSLTATAAPVTPATSNPVSVTVTIGNNSSTLSVTAKFQ